MFKICDDNEWKFLLRFKEGSIKSIAQEFNILKELDGDSNRNCKWVNEIGYNQRKVNVIETAIYDDDGNKKSYVFLTNIRITERNVDEIVYFGRSRWKIENEGFNNQKTKRYNIGHANSLNYNAMKNHYLITQLADILRQLYENGVDKIRNL
ncbi:MAG: transposase [Clostridia bacterium]